MQGMFCGMPVFGRIRKYGVLFGLFENRSQARETTAAQTARIERKRRLFGGARALQAVQVIHGAVCCDLYRNFPLCCFREVRRGSWGALVFFWFHGRQERFLIEFIGSQIQAECVDNFRWTRRVQYSRNGGLSRYFALVVWWICV